MNAVCILIYPFMCVLLPCVIYQIILIKKKGAEVSKRHSIWIFIFLIYVTMVLSVTGIGTIWDIGQYEQIIRIDEINIIPFQAGGMMSNILNVIMFMPLGFLLPLIWKNHRKIKNVLIAGAGFSFMIEIFQLFNRRATDIDDLIMNTLGAMIGFGVWSVFAKIAGKGRSKKDKSSEKWEPEMYLLLAVLGAFFLYNWKLFQ